VSKASEASRRDKVIGHSLDSIVKLELPDSIKKIVSQYVEELKFIFIVSKVELVDRLWDDEKNYVSDSLPGVKIFTERHLGQKCERCWHYFVVESKENGSLNCQRCQRHLKAAGE
jgi:isoleucyl-tRNA synthetase